MIYIYRLLHPTTAEYIFFSSSYETFTKTNHILGHKTHLTKIKRIEITQCLLSDSMEFNKKSIIERQLENPQVLGDKTTHFSITHRSKFKINFKTF